MKKDFKLEIEHVPTSELVPYARNAKKHPDWQVKQIAESIKRFGNCDPIGVWTNKDGALEIVEGHGRALALESLGIAEAPVIRLDHLTDKERRAYALVHNQTTMNTDFDDDIVSLELGALPEFEWAALGFDLDNYVEDLGEVVEDDIPQDVAPRTKRGELYQLGEHRLMCGDSTDHDDVAKLTGGRSWTC